MPVSPIFEGFGYLTLMFVGVWVIYMAVKHIPKADAPAQFSIGKSDFSLKGPAWLIMLVLGIGMAASPVIAAVVQSRSEAPFETPIQAQPVPSIPEPNYQAFRFLRDLSYLDLRDSLNRPWYAYIPGWSRLVGHHTRIRPSTLFNYMSIRKVSEAEAIHITYVTSGLLDVRCLTTQHYSVNTAYNKDQQFVAEIVVDVRDVPVNSEFTLITEVTYWNAFSVADEEDYTTYTHNQGDQPEEVSVVVVFPDTKPFKRLPTVRETPPGSETTRDVEGPYQSVPGAANKSFYWSHLNSAAGVWDYTVDWEW